MPDALIEARARELWDQMAHTLSHQGISKEAYLQIAGKTEEEMIAENREPAERDLRREAVLAAVVEAEGIEASDEDVLESLERAAAAEGGSPKKLLERLRSTGRLDTLTRTSPSARRSSTSPIPPSPMKASRAPPERAAAQRHLDARKLASAGWTRRPLLDSSTAEDIAERRSETKRGL